MEINEKTIEKLGAWKGISFNTEWITSALKGVEEKVTRSTMSGNIDSVTGGFLLERSPSVVCQSDEWAFLVLFVEAVRTAKTLEDLDLFLLRTVGLEEQGTRQLICEFFGRVMPRISKQLVSIGTNLKHIVDIKCRMDYQITNTIDGRACDGDPTYIVEMQCENPKKVVVEQVNMSCTLFELQDLVNQLKDAKSLCERYTPIKTRGTVNTTKRGQVVVKCYPAKKTKEENS